ncbi:AAA family ATPase [Mycobacterium sp. 4858]|uniref:ATP-binding protein n=1 Tax=Mycobacterium sp. 4858 TaxID=2057185 RepID=UPI000C84D236|nr:LuxR family transcriptional regulator [Mycobacterium sp. 4858]
MERLLERQEAIAELGGITRDVACGGGGRLVLVSGEAGVGKTVVLGHIVAQLDSAMQVLRGWCDPLATPRPLGPLIDALAGVGPAAARALDAAILSGDTGVLYRRLLALLRDGHHWLWVIEDAHWADGATLDLLRFLARRVDSLPLLLAVSYRDDELDRQHPLSVALGDIATCAAVSRIQLEPLSPQAVAQMATGSGVNAEQLHQLTGGNPFFVTEVLATGPAALSRQGLPHSITEAVRGRQGRLSVAARETADAVAVCGPRAPVDLVEKVCPMAGTGLGECLDAGVLVADANTIGFRHELARRATTERIPEYERRALHKRALAVLAEPPIDPDTLVALAFHAERADDIGAVIRYGPPAAERALALGANREAAELYEVTLRYAKTAPAEQRAVWLEQHAFASYACGLAEAAVSSWREAAMLRHDLGHRLAQAEDLRWLSHQLWGTGRTRQAAEAGRAALALAQGDGASRQLASSLVNMTQVGVWGFDAAAAEYAAHAMAVGAQLGDDLTIAQARGFAALARVLRTDTGWDELEAAWRDTMAADVRGEHAGLLGTCVCGFAAMHYDLDRAYSCLADAVAHCRDRNLITFEALNRGIDALLGLHRGNWDTARSAAEDVLTRPGLVAVNTTVPRLTLALIDARRGEPPTTSLLDYNTAVPFSDHLRLFPVWAARAEVAWLAGDDDTARTEAQTALAALEDEADAWLIGSLRRWAQLPGAGMAPIAVENPITPFHLEVSGDWQAAATEWTRRGCLYEAAVAQLGGDIAAVQSAHDTFRRLGARAAARRAQQRLAALRGPTRRGPYGQTLADPDGLTRRQREVLELLTSGHNTAGIAATLHISTKTTDNHIQAILAKLGVSTRAQAVAHALRDPVTT